MFSRITYYTAYVAVVFRPPKIKNFFMLNSIKIEIETAH